MADIQECCCRVLILGHSFVTWLGDFLDGEEVELGGQIVAWCRIGGAMVATLRAELGRQNVANFCMLVFVEIGSNDCAESLDVLFLPIFGLWWHISVQMVLHSSFLGKCYFFNPKSYGEDHQWNNLGCGGAAEDMNSKMRE